MCSARRGYAVFPLWRSILVLVLVCSAGAAEWHPGQGFRWTPLAIPESGKTGFALMPPASTGVSFTNYLSPDGGQTNMVLWNGSGVAAGDVDGDGMCDLYFCNLEGPNALFRNLGGWRFTNITAAAGVACVAQRSTGAVIADVDGDGHSDLLVSSIGGGVRLFLNNGRGQFRDATAASGLATNTGSMTLALSDIDSNGTLDLYVCNYRKDTFQDQPYVQFTISQTRGQPTITRVDGRPATLPELTNRYAIGENNKVIENGEPDVLYLNDGKGHFSALSWTDGSFLDENGQPLAFPPADWALSAMFRDIDGDGAPDLYVCNDTHSPDRVWRNVNHGRFRAVPRLALRQTSYSSMGVDFADLNRDGFDEIFVTDMLSREHTNRQTQLSMRRPLANPGELDNRPDYQRNTLFLNRGDGTYAEIAQFSGVEATDWTWSPLFLDVDLDGYEDLLITTGHAWNLLNIDTRIQIDTLRSRRRLSQSEFHQLRSMYHPFDCPNYAFRNRADLTFQDVSADWGFDSRQISQGMCLADLDNDGDLDVAINCFNQCCVVYRNMTTAPRLAVRLNGKSGNTHGIGAKLTLFGGPVTQTQQMLSGGRYVSSDEPIRTFAAGGLSNHLTLEVIWPTGLVSTITNVRPNCLYEVSESGATHPSIPVAPQKPPPPWFRDVSQMLRHVHSEEAFDDFELQPSLTKRLSQFGPGVGWFDIDGDGLEDLLIGTGRGGTPGLYRNLGQGRFEPFPFARSLGPAADDEALVLGCHWTSGTNALLIARSNYETGDTNGVLRYEMEGEGIALRSRLPTGAISAGPLALADLDQDGSLDLFIGGRVVRGRYPAPTSSCIYLAKSHGVEFDEVNTPLFENIGMVNSAVFTDLNGDGSPELVLACEWGTIHVFLNEHGKLAPWSPALTFSKTGTSVLSPPATLAQMSGWWQGVTAGDFNNDGRMDLVAANWGRNGRYQRYAERPLQLLCGDTSGSGRVDFLETYYDPGLKTWVPWQRWDKIAALFPFTQQRIHSYEQFSTLGVAQIIPEVLPRMARLEVNTTESVVLLNRGDHFEVQPLPLEAQLAPCFGVCVADLDGNGTEDILMSQNFFGVDRDTSRYDAGRGVLLLGDGQGGFRAVSGQSSGLLVYGEGRGAALCDYDADARVDVAVAQNGADTKLYHNEHAQPGLRVRLLGPASNPQAIGAQLRLSDGSRLGPAREIHLGAGWLSQDAAGQVMCAGFQAKEIHVLWPGGKRTISPIPAGARAISVDHAGKVTSKRP
jgi:hypothetical protein